jgi:hypothetical protein
MRLAVFWDWLGKQPLNKRRDNRLREIDRVALATTLKAELESIHKTLTDNAKSLMAKPPQGLDAGFILPDIVNSIKVLPHLLPKIGFLSPPTVRSVMDAYIFAEQYYEKIFLLGGHNKEKTSQDRRTAYLDKSKASIMAELNQLTADFVEKAINALGDEVKGKATFWGRLFRRGDKI